MKHLLLFALLALISVACSKESDETVAPDAALLVSGTYSMNYYRLDSADVRSETNLPLIQDGRTVALGTMVVTRGTAANSINLGYHLVVVGSEDEDLDFGDFTLQKNGNSYDMYNGTQKYGTVDGTNLSYDETFTGSDNAVYRLLINAQKATN